LDYIKTKSRKKWLTGLEEGSINIKTEENKKRLKKSDLNKI
jgi:hypothetical protein